MAQQKERTELTIQASIGKHLALAPVAFAVTEGPSHALVYANAMFRQLESSGDVVIGRSSQFPSATDLAPLLDRVSRNGDIARDAILRAPGADAPSWSCTVWPVPGSDDEPDKLVVEVRSVHLVEGAKARQRAIAERLLLGALREQAIARAAVEAGDRARYLAKASRDLAMSLDERTTRDAVRRLTLPRPGTWCIVDVIESNGAITRLAVAHPDPAKQELARLLERPWEAATGTAQGAAIESLRSIRPTVISHDSGAALMRALHGEENLAVLRQIGFGAILVVPLIVRAHVQGAITFVSGEGEPHFSPDEIALAVDVGARCALALDNARLYREADALRLAAELANQSKSQFLGSMSHELRTPLNAIGGFTELIDMGIEGPVTERQHAALARIKANQQHLLTLISDILNFVRIESGRMEYQYAEVPLDSVFAEVTTMLAGAISDRGLRLEGPLGARDLAAWADADRVRQILVNLLMNAVKYTPQGGGTITIESEAADAVVKVHVTDTGPGISSEKLESIFEPFVQLSSGLADRRGGVGLGLAISRDLARAMNGDLTVESTIGVGSRFTLALPRARARSRGPAVRNGEAEYQARGVGEAGGAAIVG